MNIVSSVSSVPIRLSSERWMHIVENNDDLAGMLEDVLGAVEYPDIVLEGRSGELLAIKLDKPLSIVAVYREVASSEGFIITAFQTSKINQLVKTRKIIWRKQQ